MVVVTTARNFVLVARVRRRTEVQLRVILDNIFSRDPVNLGLRLTRQGRWDNVKKLSVFLLKITILPFCKEVMKYTRLGFSVSTVLLPIHAVIAEFNLKSLNEKCNDAT